MDKKIDDRGRLSLVGQCYIGNCEANVGAAMRNSLINPRSFHCESGYVTPQCPGYVVCDILEAQNSEDLRCPVYRNMRKSIFLDNQGRPPRVYARAVRDSIIRETEKSTV